MSDIMSAKKVNVVTLDTDEEQAVEPSDSESESSRRPNKITRYRKAGGDPRVDVLIGHVSSLTHIIRHYHSSQSTGTVTPSPFCAEQMVHPSAVESLDRTNSAEELLTRPAVGATRQLNLGELETSIDNAAIIRSAPQERLDSLIKIQRFGTEGWKEVKYRKALQSLIAKPGFIELEVNPELMHFNKGKDYLAGTERTMAGLSFGLLEQKDIIKKNLQSVVDWAASSPDELNPSSLFDKIETLFGPKSQSYTNMEQLMQVVSGKRTECIEIRRDKIISQVPNESLQKVLRNIPPSAQSLFDNKSLSSLIQAQSGAHMWLNTPTYLKEHRALGRKLPAEMAPSTSNNYISYSQTTPGVNTGNYYLKEHRALGRKCPAEMASSTSNNYRSYSQTTPGVNTGNYYLKEHRASGRKRPAEMASSTSYNYWSYSQTTPGVNTGKGKKLNKKFHKDKAPKKGSFRPKDTTTIKLTSIKSQAAAL